MRYDIVTYGASVLRRKADPIERITDAIRNLAGDMLNAMYRVKGVGLAGQQVGKPIALCVIDIPVRPDAEGEPVASLAATPFEMPLIMINPRITEKIGLVTEQEGCLSFPEIYAPVQRAAEVTVTYTDEEGNPRTLHATDLLARAVQHELDHLSGVLIVDRMSAVKKVSLAGQLRRLKRETLDRLGDASS